MEFLIEPYLIPFFIFNNDFIFKCLFNSPIFFYLMMQEYHDLFKVMDELHKWDWKYFSNALTLNLNIIVIKLLYNNRIMIVEPMVQRRLPRKDSINPLSKKQNLGILTFYKVRLFNMYETLLEHWKIITHTT